MNAPSPCPDTKLLEVVGYVRSKHSPAHRDEAGQIAFLAAHETRRRYGHKFFGNPFAYLCGPAFTETTLELRRQAAVCSISEKAARGRVKADVSGVFTRKSLYRPSKCANGREERYAAEGSANVSLRGELDRLQKVVEMLQGLDKREKRLIVLAVVDARGSKLGSLALRSRLSKDRAATVLREFAAAVGPDPSVNHLARVISRS